MSDDQPNLDFEAMAEFLVAESRDRKIAQAYARRTDPQTSHVAAKRVTNSAKVREAILELFREFGPMHDEVLIRMYRSKNSNPAASDSGIRTRRKELKDAGLIRECVKLAETRAGNPCAVWEIVK
jgi:hypothetical protein